jgi:hypothetical protein
MMNTSTITITFVVLIIIGMIFLIAGNQPPQPEVIRTQETFDVLCLNGVEYWYRQVGYESTLAPRFNPDGISVTKCEVD